MKWAVEDKVKTSDSGKSKSTHTLETHIQNTRNKFEQRRLECAQLRARACALRASARSMGARYLQRARWDTEREADEIDEEVAIRESRVREHEFDQQITQYVKAFRQRLQVVPETTSACRAESIDAYVKQHDATSLRQASIVSEYLTDIDKAPPKLALHTRDLCPKCNSSLILNNSKATMSCETCGFSVVYLDATTTSMSYTDEIEFSTFSYKRINHFNEWLSQVQAKENFECAQDMLTSIMEEMYKQRLELKDLNPQKVREVLKTLRLRKAYEHVVAITSILTGEQPMQLSPEAEDKCRLMFMAVQPAFDKHCGTRKNFFSYSYILYKFFQLLGYERLLDAFTLLKGRDKLFKQDEIWKKVCMELSWEFLPSV